MKDISRKTSLIKPRDSSSPVVVLNCADDTGKETARLVRGLTDKDFGLICISGLNWNRDLSPWPAEAVFRGGERFPGGADEYLRDLMEDVIPGVLCSGGLRPEHLAIAGYSLAGLFALYALYKTGMFSGAASVSGSLWYPGFMEFAENHTPVVRPEGIYLSLGDREEHTKNPVMRTVGERTRRLKELYEHEGISCIYEENPGNHFQEPELRTARAIAWLLREGKEGHDGR